MTDKKQSIEKRLSYAACVTALPSTIILCLLLFFGDFSWLLIVTIFLIIALSWLAGIAYVYHNTRSYLFTIANLIEGIRHGDYGFRLNLFNKSGAGLDVSKEINLLVENMQKKRLTTIESSIVLEKLINEIDIPLLVIDSSEAVQNANYVAAQLFNQKRFELIGLSAEQLKVKHLLSLSSGTIVEHRFPAGGGRWEIKSKIIVSDGKKYRLLVISDVRRALRVEERNAWSRIVRVIGHELNNSLTSISSLAETLLLQLSRQKDNADYSQVQKGLEMIVERGDSLQRFMTAYARLAKLPPPNCKNFMLVDLLQKVTDLYSQNIVLENIENVVLNADQDQLLAALINLVKNAMEASSKDATVFIRSVRKYQGVVIQVIDQGKGVANQDNLFVPFYTTKNHGSGIGLVLSREIAEAHNGTLNLRNRKQGEGCIAELWLPSKAENT